MHVVNVMLTNSEYTNGKECEICVHVYTGFRVFGVEFIER